MHEQSGKLYWVGEVLRAVSRPKWYGSGSIKENGLFAANSHVPHGERALCIRLAVEQGKK